MKKYSFIWKIRKYTLATIIFLLLGWLVWLFNDESIKQIWEEINGNR